MCKRVDAAPVDKLVEKDEETVNILSEEETAKLKDIFAKQIADDTYEVQAEALSPKSALLAVTEDEFSRRMQDMSRMQGNGIFEAMPQKYNVVINTNHHKAKIFLNEKAEDKMKKAFNLALLSKGLLKGEALFEFLKAEEESI